MSTKHKLLSVLLILATVVTLCVVMAAPASATINAGTVTFTPTTTTVSSVSIYTIGWTQSVAAVPLSGTVTVTFPVGTTVPATIAPANVTMTDSADNPTVLSVAVVGRAVTITTGPAAGDDIDIGACTIVFAAGAAIANPATAGSYVGTLASSLDTAPVTSTAYNIGTGAGAVSSLTNTITPNTANVVATQLINFTTSSAGALTANVGTISVTFPTGVVVPATISKYYVSVYESGGGTAAATALTVDPTVVGQTVTIVVPTITAQTITTSEAIGVTFGQLAGIKNPTLSQTVASGAYRVVVTTSADATPISSVPYAVDDWITASPMSAAKGATITVVGAGFYPGSSVDLTGGATGTGTVATDGTINVAGVGAGTLAAITATDGSARIAATATAVAVLPRLSTNPTSVKVGDQFQVTGYDFTTSGTLSATTALTLGGTAITITPPTFSDRDGDTFADDFTFLSAVLAGTTGGVKTVVVTDAAGRSGTCSITIASQAITLSPTSGAAGSQVTITGTGFAANATGGTVTIDPTGLTSVITPTGNVSTDGSGAFTAVVTITSGLTVTGTYPIVVAFGATTASAQFTLSARVVTLSPASGPAGTMTVLSGSNMPGATVTPGTGGLLFNYGLWAGAPTTIAIDSSKNITPTTLYVPTAAPVGTRVVIVTDNTGVQAMGLFVVTKPTIELSATSAARGDTITVTGSGWVPGARGLVQIRMPAGTLVTTAIPDASGNITATFTVPTSIGVIGTLSTTTFDATDTYTNATVVGTFTIPAGSLSVSPATAAIGSEVTITGTGFTPLSGVTAATIGGANILPAGSAFITDSIGGFTITASAPGVAVGGQVVSVTAGGVTATAALTLTAAVVQPTVVTVASGFNSIASQLVSNYVVWSFNNQTKEWLFNDTTVGAPTPTLTSLTAGAAYYFEVGSDCTLTYNGHTYTLYAGWNSIGWQG